VFCRLGEGKDYAESARANRSRLGSKTLHVPFDYFGASWSEESYRDGDLIGALCEKVVEFN
jgi:hypothetical protein